MPWFTKESLEKLREKIDLVEVLDGYLDLKREGSAYKACCPFHEEKTPSFIVQKGRSHYHCFGCGAHGDAISFVMHHLHFSFVETVESLAERFSVPLEVAVKSEEKGPQKALLKEVLIKASEFYHFCLLHTEEGKEALYYLFSRGIHLAFIQRFEIGYAPKSTPFFLKVMLAQNLSKKALGQGGLLYEGREKAFFSDRITFPIRNRIGALLGFSARKYKEETFGGKYINTPETLLFKKSQILFGLNYARQRIIKEKKALIVEGQMDCLRLIDQGFDCTVAALGTAFGQEHVNALQQLDVRYVYLIFDSDKAGRAATSKVGDLFQKKGIGVKVVTLPKGSDPDTFLLEEGPEALKALLEKGVDYLLFQIEYLSKEFSVETPVGKSGLVRTLKKQIEGWEDNIVVYESLRQVEKVLGLPGEGFRRENAYLSSAYLKSKTALSIDPHRILEIDFLRWLLLSEKESPECFRMAKKLLTPQHFWVPMCRHIFTVFLEKKNKQEPVDFISLIIEVGEEGEAFLKEIFSKAIDLRKKQTFFKELLQKLLDRQWMWMCEKVKRKMLGKPLQEKEMMQLTKEFDALKKNRPQVTLEE